MTKFMSSENTELLSHVNLHAAVCHFAAAKFHNQCQRAHIIQENAIGEGCTHVLHMYACCKCMSLMSKPRPAMLVATSGKQRPT